VSDAYRITNLPDLERLYGPARKSSRKESDHIHSGFQEFIEKAPFMVLATNGLDGLDASAKGDAGGFVKVLDGKTLLIPDRGANSRNDSLRNIVTDARVGLIFFIPGVSEMIRVSGQAHVSIDPHLLSQFSGEPAIARSVIVVHVDEAFSQCSRAIQRSNLWSLNLHSNAPLNA
jgi:PPOX class probable FMN-dependent enzyme